MPDPTFEQLLDQLVNAVDPFERECARANVRWAFKEERERANRKADRLVAVLYGLKDSINDALAG